MGSYEEPLGGYPMSNGRAVPAAGLSRPSTAASSVRSGVGGRLVRSSSPQAPQARINANELDHRSIIALSQSCTEDLTSKMQDKNRLLQMLNANKKKKMQYDARIGKKKREVDSTVVQTMDLEKKLQMLTNTCKMMQAELSGLRSENERTENEVEQLRKDLADGTEVYEAKCDEVEGVKRMHNSYRKEILGESKHRDSVQQDLRASRTAQNLMINRLDDMEKRNRALKNCVANTFNS